MEDFVAGRGEILDEDATQSSPGHNASIKAQSSLNEDLFANGNISVN